MKGSELLNEFKEKILWFHGYDKNQNKIAGKKKSEQGKGTAQLSPIDFLRFANEDLKSTYGQRGIANCLTNCKRGIDCQIDDLIKKLGYLPLSRKKRWHFTQKIQFIRSIGVIAPRILEKVNTLRNELEHRFKMPSIDQAEDALDIASLFISYANIVRLPSLSTGIYGGIHVKYDYDEMSFSFFRQAKRGSGKNDNLVDLGYRVKYGQPEFTELYDFLTKIVPNL